MVKVFIPMVLLTCTYFIGQLYQLFDNEYWNNKGLVNWIWLEERAMLVSWNVKLLSEEINRVIEGIAMLVMSYYTGFKIFQLTATAYVTYRCLDVILWFVNFKTHHYWYVFFVLAFIEFWLWYKDDISKIIKKEKHL